MTKVSFDSAYQIGETVYLMTDPEQLKRIVTGYSLRPGGLMYEVSHADYTSMHYEFELSPDKQIQM